MRCSRRCCTSANSSSTRGQTAKLVLAGCPSRSTNDRHDRVLPHDDADLLRRLRGTEAEALEIELVVVGGGAGPTLAIARQLELLVGARDVPVIEQLVEATRATP